MKICMQTQAHRNIFGMGGGGTGRLWALVVYLKNIKQGEKNHINISFEFNVIDIVVLNVVYVLLSVQEVEIQFV